MNKYEKYKNSGVDWIGDIPENWDVIKFKYLFDLQKGKNPQYLSSVNGLNKYIYLSMDYLRGKDKEVSYSLLSDNLTFVDENQILLLWDGANAGEFISSKRGILSSTMASVTTSKMSNRFSWYYLKSYESKLKKVTIGMGIPHVNGEELKNALVILPPLEEQETIAKYLDEKTANIEQAISQKEKMISLLKEEKQIIIQNAVTKGLNPNAKMKDSGVDFIGDIPEHWEVKKLKYIGKIYSGISGKNGNDFSKENNGFLKPYIPFTNICNNTKIENNKFHYVNIKKGENQNLVKKNDLLFLMSSETLTEIAKNSIYLGDETELYLNSFCKGVRITSKIIFPEYINYLYISQVYRNYFMLVGRGFTRINLKQEYINDAQTLLPPIDEQKEIVEYIDTKLNRIDKIIELQFRQIEKLKELKTTLIDNAVTGKIKVC